MKNPPPPIYQTANSGGRPASLGFSLVEVTLAVGIVFIGIVTMLGILPVGLTTMRDAMDATVRAQIAQRITAEALVLPFTKLDELLNKTCYFDNEGFKQKEKDSNTRFEVIVEKVDAVFPGSSKGDQLDQSLTTLKVHVQLRPGQEPPATYVVLVPNRGG